MQDSSDTKIDWVALSLSRGWAAPPPRAGTPWTEQESNDLRAKWGVWTPEALAEHHGRSVSSILGHAQTLSLEGAPTRPAKPEKPAKATSEPEGVVLKTATPKPASKPEVPPDIKILCVAGLSENCARVILLAAQHMSHAEIAQVLALPSGVRSVSSYFQLAGVAWGIAGKGAHRAIVERACNLLQGRGV